MKNFFKVLGVIALVAVIGFSIVACGGDDGNGDKGGGGGSGSGGTFTLTGIPDQYNGKYAMFTGIGGPYGLIMGSESPSNNNGTIEPGKLAKINNGSVKIPLWIPDVNSSSSGKVVRYSGNDTTGGGRVDICTQQNYRDNTSAEGSISFASITFSKGNATKAWTEGTWNNQ